MSFDTFERDWTHEVRENGFVRNIAESTYSQYVEEVFSILETVKEEAISWLKMPPTITRQTNEVTDYVKNQPVFKIKEVVTETVSKITVADFLLKIADVQTKCLKGDIVDTSVALLQDRIKQLEKKNVELAQRANAV